jgi:hypothetical protein
MSDSRASYREFQLCFCSDGGKWEGLVGRVKIVGYGEEKGTEGDWKKRNEAWE